MLSLDDGLGDVEADPNSPGSDGRRTAGPPPPHSPRRTTPALPHELPTLVVLGATSPGGRGCKGAGYTGGVNETSPEAFEHAIKETHGAKAQFLFREPVVEEFEDETVWEGEVLVFALKGHPTSHLCYAWEVDGLVTAVLHQPPVDSPLAAVRAAIRQEYWTCDSI